METIEEVELKFGKKYSFPICSTTGTETVRTIESYLMFHEDRLEWRGSYEALSKEEDESMGIDKETTRTHYWDSFFKKQSLSGADVYRWHDEDLWAIKIFTNTQHDIILAFYDFDKAEKMHKRIKRYLLNT